MSRCRATLFVTTLLSIIFSITTVVWAAEKQEAKQLDWIVVDTLRPLFETISTNPWIQSILVILITVTCASLLTWLIFKIILAITQRTQFLFDAQVARLLRPPIYYTLVVIGLTAGIGLMPLTVWKVHLIRIIRTIGILIWVIFAIRLATLLLQRVAGLSDKYTFIQHRTVTLFDNFAKIGIFGAGVYAFFVVWNIDMTAWLASAGIAGIAIGFAAKDSLSNLFSGVFIIADAPYKVGDYIELDKGGRGKVLNIGLRSTRILTRDDIEVTIPNSIIGNSTIINQSGGPHEKMRIRLKIGVAYGSDVDKVKRILVETAKADALVCSSPEPRIRFRQFGASSLDFELLFWVDNPELKGMVLDSMNTAVYNRLREECIEIPYAKQDLYIKGLPEALSSVVTDDSREPPSG
ncbi:MAG: mechanosensitive ion channel family protein [Desulfofustis sp.]|nr:mechanosensitive ion channel family protein [Desulfofustis sp.]